MSDFLVWQQLSVVRAFITLNPRDDVCNPEKCKSSVNDNDGDPSYECVPLRPKDFTSAPAPASTRDPDPKPEEVTICQNCAKIKTAKSKFDGVGCNLANSKGLQILTQLELACSGALDEISNAEDGEAIERYVRYAALVREENRTRKGILFVVYQTGRHGPQNGFRLALVKEDVEVAVAVERLKGEVVQDAAECIVIRP
ncbi:MAG: hypothetical protein Q9213_006767 [Squamulea squamosa]